MIRRIASMFKSQRQAASKPMLEPMEKRLLFAAPRATSVITDNRGEVQITFDTALDPTTVKSTTVQIHTQGADNLFGTADDVKIDGIVRVKTGNRRIWWRPRVAVPFAAGTTFSVKVSGKFVKGANGDRIDGEFNGAGVISGNGTGGGDLLFLSKRDKSAAPTARFSTVMGNIDVLLDTVNTPLTYANFLHYSDNGLWDYSFIHRSAYLDATTPFVVQGGGFNVGITTNDMGIVPTVASPTNEFHTSNTRGTIAMAKLGSDPNSATDQWFFNEGDNSGGPASLDTQNGGFTVFGTIKNAGGLSVMDALGALTRKNLQNSIHDPSGISVPDPQFQQSVLDETPVINGAATPGALNPLADLAIVRRIAILNKVVAFPFPT